MWRIVGLLIVASCSGPAAPKPDHGGLAPTVTGKRNVTRRDALPEALRSLPAHAIYAAGMGSVSTAWRVVVDADANTIVTSATGAEDKRRDLSPRNEVLLMRLAEDAWREPLPAAPEADPATDYFEILVVLDGDDAFLLKQHGPIRRPLAAKAIFELRAAAGL